VIEPHYLNEQPEFAAESDKAWDAMHRTLADGLLTWTGGEYPLNHVVLGGKLVYSQSDYIMSLKSPTQVKDVAVALAQVSEATFRERYFRIDPAQYGVDLSDEDFGYTWEWFQNVSRAVRARSSRRAACLVYCRSVMALRDGLLKSHRA